MVDENIRKTIVNKIWLVGMESNAIRIKECNMNFFSNNVICVQRLDPLVFENICGWCQCPQQ
jgi:hypothetical protein